MIVNNILQEMSTRLIAYRIVIPSYSDRYYYIQKRSRYTVEGWILHREYQFKIRCQQALFFIITQYIECLEDILTVNINLTKYKRSISIKDI